MWLSVFLRSLVARFGIHTTAQLLARVYILQFQQFFLSFYFVIGKIADDRVVSPLGRCVISIKILAVCLSLRTTQFLFYLSLIYIKIILNNFYIFGIYLVKHVRARRIYLSKSCIHARMGRDLSISILL